jgi:hypothetical protein
MNQLDLIKKNNLLLLLEMLLLFRFIFIFNKLNFKLLVAIVAKITIGQWAHRGTER